jgi:hypothetical protein
MKIVSSRHPSVLFMLLALCAWFGCSGGSNATAPDGGSAARGGTGGGTGAAGQTGAGGAASCAPRASYGGGETSMAGASVTASIVDETGTPVAGQPTYICGLDLCSAPAVTDSAGHVSVQTTLTMKKPAFKYGDGVSYAELSIPLTAATTDFTAGGKLLALGKLAGKPGVPLAPGSSATSGDVTIAVPAGATVGIDTLVYDTADSQMFRAVAVPLTNLGPVLDPVEVAGAPADFSLLYGVGPAETTLCPPAKISVALPHATAAADNDLGWVPGTAVEFWITTTDTGQTYAPYAGWAKMSDGVVSADGSTATTLDGALEGFVFLESFAIRKAQ